MKLEYLQDLTANGKFKHVVSQNLIRLWDFGCQESKQFQTLIKDFVADDLKSTLSLDQQDFIEPLNCKLTLIKDRANNGINRLSDDAFTCNLSIDSFKHIVKLVEPFVHEDSSGHQWLDGKANVGNIEFLFTPGGTW
jgi:hypothetical protein